MLWVNAKKFASFYKHPFNIHDQMKYEKSIEEIRMKQTLAIISLLLFMGVSLVAQSKSGQSKSTTKAQIVDTAEIVKIDAKKRTLQVRNVAEGTPTKPRPERRGGGGFPQGGGRRRGGGYPGGGYPGGGRFPDEDGGSPGGTAPSQVREYKVFVTKDTVLKLEDMDMEFSDLHVGDHIVVSGYPKGGSGDLEATLVTRKF